MSDCSESAGLPLGTNDARALSCNASTIDNVVNSAATTTTNRVGNSVSTLSGINAALAQFELDADTAIAAAGYSVIGDFADATLPTVNNPNEVLTSKSVVGFEGYVWRTNQTLPYTPTGADPTQSPEAGKWLAVAIGELQTIARSLNISDTEIIYSTDTATSLDNVLYIYDPSSQTTWTKPVGVGAGETVVSVVGSNLTTSAGIYTMTALPSTGNGVFTERSFGWIGDGTTDNGDIQVILDLISADGGGDINLGRGEFLFDEFNTPDGVFINGIGPNHEAIAGDTGTILNIRDSAAIDCITLGEDGSTCGLRNLSVRVRGTSAVNSIVRSKGVLRPVIDNVEAEYEGANNPGPTSVTISGAANNGSGLIRITTSSSHNFLTGNIVDIENIVGTVEANGSWKITVIDTTNFDLQASAFSVAYTSGGTAHSLGAGFLMDRGAAFETLYADLDIKSHSANSGLVLFDDSNAISVNAASTLQGKVCPLRLIGQASFNTGFSCRGAVEGAYNTGFKHEFVPGGVGIIDAIAPVDLYVVLLAEFEVGEGISIPSGYWELAGSPGTYDDGNNGVHPLFPAVKIGSQVVGFHFRALMRARFFDLGIQVDVSTTSGKSHDTRVIPHLVARTNAQQTIPAFANTAINYTAQVLENDPTTFTVIGTLQTVYESGTYRINAMHRLQALTANADFLFLRVRAGTVFFDGPNVQALLGKEPGVGVSCIATLAAGDTIEVFMFQSAGSEKLSAAFDQNYLCIERC